MEPRIIILNGNPDKPFEKLESVLNEFSNELKSSGANVAQIKLREKEISYCVGCWDCWWKTPGVCRHSDDMEEILKLVIHADLVVFASPVSQGFYSALLKKCQDRLIPLVHPYIEIVNGELHHKKRYPQYPELAAIIEANDASEEELKTIQSIFKRLAINFKTQFRFFYTTDSINPKEMIHEISNL